MSEAAGKLRADKWLWQARFFKTRSLSAKLITGSHLRVNSDKVMKTSATVKVGDVLTFPQGNHIRVIRVEGIGTRRGPASEAQTLYTDLSPPQPRDIGKPYAERGGRPSKAERRIGEQIKRGELE
ncbi:MAG: RNA-binding S4 domain-containing protein [Planktotalea sp.]|uniref:RNA-binding S4 domain-containing protein n=1 Tax=Planktotalea sp. TaxID=2029877 RepID=UPI003C74D810